MNAPNTPLRICMVRVPGQLEYPTKYISKWLLALESPHISPCQITFASVYSSLVDILMCYIETRSCISHAFLVSHFAMLNHCGTAAYGPRISMRSSQPRHLQITRHDIWINKRHSHSMYVVYSKSHYRDSWLIPVVYI